jgi:hypothetical protein
MYYSIFNCRMPIANWKSASENRQCFLPACLDDAGDLSLQRQVAKADTAQVKLAQIAAGAATPFTTRVGSRFEFWPPSCLCNQ